jgi:hypothetical protein
MATIEIVGAAEVAEILGIGNTNFSHLRKQRAGTDDAFPDPIVVLKCGPIWKKSDAVKYAKTYAARRRHIPAPAAPNGTAVEAKNGTAVAKKVASTPKAKATPVEKAAATPSKKVAPREKVAPRKLPAKKAPVKKLALAR